MSNSGSQPGAAPAHCGDPRSELLAQARSLFSRVASSDYVLNAVSRLKAPPRAAAVATPETLKLKEEPQADLNRYDALLGKLVLVAAMMAPGFVMEVSRGTA